MRRSGRRAAAADVPSSSSRTRPRLTVEIRWILEGPCPDEVRQRSIGKPPASPEERTDHYLLTGAGTVGVKMRGVAAG